MRMRLTVVVLLCVGLMFPFISGAQDKDDEQEFQKALADLGISAGNAMQCVGEDETKTSTIASQADTIGGGLLKDSGSQSAFRFMVYFGIGIGETIDKDKCAAYLADWNQFTAKYPDLPQLK